MFDVFRAELLRFPSDIFAFFLRKSGFSVNLWKCAAADRDGHFLLSPTKGKCLLVLTGAQRKNEEFARRKNDPKSTHFSRGVRDLFTL